ncbi:MAG: ATPase domain-containing protein [Verrucomicrobiota bacterium]
MQPVSDRPSPTGISGLDEILRGGLPENRLHLLLGNPGVGKTTLAFQYLLEGARVGEKGLYIALSETRDEILSVARSHGWPIDEIAIFELSALEQQLAQEERNTVFHPAEIELNKTTQLLLQRIQEVKPKRLVLDSLSELRLLSDSPLRYRRQMLSLKQFFAGAQMTVLLLDDHSADGGDLHVQSIAHGVLKIEKILSDYGSEKRRITINKMRGLNFVGGYHDAMIVPGGIKVFPRVIGSAHKRQNSRGPMPSGVKELDALLGGGLDRGTSCLFLGPAGSGKSTVALQFAIAAAKRGDVVLLCLFEENLDTMLARAASVGMPLEQLIADGKIVVREVDPAELAPGEFAHLVIDQVKTKGTRMVVIDSLNGYMQAMPNVSHLTIQLHELLSFLNRHGVLSIMTVAQHGLIGAMQSPVDLTYLADSVVLLRYFEQAGRIKKAISVIKKRIGRHEDTLREFRIDDQGIRVGEPLDQFHGVLTGTPVFRGESDQMLQKR